MHQILVKRYYNALTYKPEQTLYRSIPNTCTNKNSLLPKQLIRCGTIVRFDTYAEETPYDCKVLYIVCCVDTNAVPLGVR